MRQHRWVRERKVWQSIDGNINRMELIWLKLLMVRCDIFSFHLKNYYLSIDPTFDPTAEVMMAKIRHVRPRRSSSCLILGHTTVSYCHRNYACSCQSTSCYFMCWWMHTFHFSRNVFKLNVESWMNNRKWMKNEFWPTKLRLWQTENRNNFCTPTYRRSTKKYELCAVHEMRREKEQTYSVE